MNRNAGLIFLLFAAFSVAAGWFYVCKVKQGCVQGSGPSEVSITSPIDDPIVFSWGDSIPMKGNRFDRMHNRILQELGPNGLLEIVGYYDWHEGTSELGQQRARAIRGLFPELQDERLHYLSRQMELDSTRPYFIASKLNVIFGHQQAF